MSAENRITSKQHKTLNMKICDVKLTIVVCMC